MTPADAQRAANELACTRIAACRPVLCELVTASAAIGLRDGELGHAGPPFEPGQAPSAVVLQALAGAALHERWAGSLNTARDMVLRGEIRLRANHTMGIVSPMAGVVRPSQRLFRLEDAVSGAVSFATLAERGRRVLRFGHYDADVAEGLRYVESVVAEAVMQSLPNGGLPILPLLSRAVELGDDLHQRNVAGMLSFLTALQPLPMGVRDWLLSNPQHFLNYAMAAAKLSLDRGAGTTASTIVTAITRNGIDCAVSIAGLPGQWFKAPATQPSGIWFEGTGPADAHLDLGDSAIMESYGVGGCIAHTAPEIAATLKRPWSEACAAGQAMRALFLSQHPELHAALAGTAGVGLGLDAALVPAVSDGVRIHTGVAHRDGRTGWIGIGIAHAPVACFAAAVDAIRHRAYAIQPIANMQHSR